MNNVRHYLYEIPENVKHNMLNFKECIDKYMDGIYTDIKFRSLRVPMGIYEQRESGKYMVRIRIPGGVLLLNQAETIANLSREYGNGIVHVTTRQDMQLHEINIEDTPDILRQLLDIGLSPRGGGGNTVRNITACPRSGVCPYEIFDVTGYTMVLTEYLLSDESSFNLPRKLKIVFSGCSEDCSFASVADIGFFAHIKNGQKGFSVYAGGGLGQSPQIGVLIEDFVSDDEIYEVAEAMKQLFDMHGDRTNKYRARLRYVLRRLGEKKFIELYKKRRTSIKNNKGIGRFRRRHYRNLSRIEKAIYPDIKDEGKILSIDKIKSYNYAVFEEKRQGFYTIKLKLPAGDLPCNDLIHIIDIAKDCGNKYIRTTQHQNVLLCSIKGEYIDGLFEKLSGLSIESSTCHKPEIVTCTGAATCKLGLCLSRGLAEAIDKRCFKGSFNNDLSHISIKISGCPNACGAHYLADIGFQGSARRIGSKLMPFYDMYFGAHIEEGHSKLGVKVGSLPAKAIPDFLNTLDIKKLPNSGKELQKLIENFKSNLGQNYPEDFFRDFGAEKRFTLAGRGPGECGAGVMDVIKLDIDEAKDKLKELTKNQENEKKSETLYNALLTAARSLLVVFGEEPEKEREVFSMFQKHLINPGWVKPEVQELIDAAVEWRMGDRDDLSEFYLEIKNLLKRIEELFYSLDSNLKFTVKSYFNGGSKMNNISISYKLDLRGVKCPMNYVKAKLALDKIKVGETCEMLLDEGEPAKNVPLSIQEQGQKVVELKKQNNYYILKVLKQV